MACTECVMFSSVSFSLRICSIRQMIYRELIDLCVDTCCVSKHVDEMKMSQIPKVLG